jgi:two-component system response regulator PilR (NtrC family)
MKRILVVDDEASMRELLGIMLRKEGFEVLTADSRAQASAAFGEGAIHMVITDVKLPDGDGIEILRHVKAASPETVVVVMTAFGTTETAVAALKLGAQDYLVKPFDIEELKIVVRNSLERRELQDENLRLKAELRTQHGLDQIIGVSPPMTAVFDMVRSVSGTSSTILITGESGTGKDLVAKAIHTLSTRRDSAFVSVNCGAVPENLLESELFGHVRGAFTDAHQNKKGLFEVAHRGTIFLDEIAELPLAMQVKLLRVLQDRRFRRVGGTVEMESDVRVLAATNRPIEQLVKERLFREDLYYRLNVIPLRMPALRERPEDVPLLAEHFLRRFSREMGKEIATISTEAMERLRRYRWPGNVRELENVIERAVALEQTRTVLAERLPEVLFEPRDGRDRVSLGRGFSLDDHLNRIESDLLQQALREAEGDRSRASELLGVTPRSLRYLLQKHRVASPERPQ